MAKDWLDFEACDEAINTDRTDVAPRSNVVGEDLELLENRHSGHYTPRRESCKWTPFGPENSKVVLRPNSGGGVEGGAPGERLRSSESSSWALRFQVPSEWYGLGSKGNAEPAKKQRTAEGPMDDSPGSVDEPRLMKRSR